MRRRFVFIALAALLLPACAQRPSCHVRTCCSPPSEGPRIHIQYTLAPELWAIPSDPQTADPATHNWFDAAGTKLRSASSAVARVLDADVILFGELHGHAVGAQEQLRLLKAAYRTGRPVALAMEFLERDVQPVVDQYLRSEIDNATFRKNARLSKAYPTTHGPLIEYCKANGIAVIAANAPRPLVKAYRKTEVDYETFLAERTEAERATLPRTTSTPDDPYKERFLAFMSASKGPAFFRSQALWDDAMAEAVTDWRESHPDALVILVIGAFHASHGGGTLTKIRARRPNDRITSIVMDFATEPLTFTEEDQGAGTVLLKVPSPPKKTPASSETPSS